MTGLLRRRLQLQLALIFLAGGCMALLSALLIRDALRGAESLVLSETRQALGAALGELDRQALERVTMETDWPALAPELRAVSLGGISQTVLRSYPGIEGGYLEDDAFLGYSFPTHDNPTGKTDVPAAEAESIREVGRASVAGLAGAERVLRGASDVVLIRAQHNPRTGLTAWTMKRIAGLGDPAAQQRRWLLVALVAAALLSLAATAATAASLARGVHGVKRGLEELERDFHHTLEEPSGELGEIARAVNRMTGIRRKLEGELRREDRLRSMGRLVAAVAHEVRNPLNGIRLTAQLLERQFGSNESVTAIIQETDRLEALVRDLLVFERGEAVQVRRQPVAPVVERAWMLLRSQAGRRGVRMRFEQSEPELMAAFDAAYLQQTLLNLFLNAIEAMPGGGEIHVAAPRIGAEVLLRVSDTGPGLTEDQQERIFEMFYSTKTDGTGLGLAVSRQLVENMGGRLEYEAAPAGAIFAIRLPG
ncbi:MAG: hypothetical protein HY822_04020 [Acidobacteria bacterium]|nr:hypothetical protein [Acidobacteriota bacterium]